MRKTTASKKPRVVVHLGNIGLKYKGEPIAGKTIKHAKRFPNVRFIGIDLRKVPKRRLRENWQQKKTDFVTGLNQLRNNSVDIISSEMSVGYYAKRKVTPGFIEQNHPLRLQYTKDTIATAYQKLKPGGKLHIALEELEIKDIKEAIENGPFAEENITIREFTEAEYKRTYWTQRRQGQKIKLFQVIAVK